MSWLHTLSLQPLQCNPSAYAGHSPCNCEALAVFMVQQCYFQREAPPTLDTQDLSWMSAYKNCFSHIASHQGNPGGTPKPGFQKLGFAQHE